MADQEEDQGITAYHGSPHKFDKFDLSKIGTGEGAQAYGHGLYFAESEPVAKGYRDQLKQDFAFVDGEKIPHPSEENPDTNLTYTLANHLYQMGWNVDQAIDFANKHAESLKADLESENQYKRGKAEHAQKWAKDIAPFKGKKVEWKQDPGHMYEVSINAHPDHFLDWDKPLSEQHPHVQSKFIEAMAGNDPLVKELIQGLTPEDYGMIGLFPKSKGSQAYKTLSDQVGGSEKASKILNDLGVRGIKYLDAGSRRDTDKPTRNYVVFDDKLVNVKRRYARGGRIGYADGGSPSIAQKIMEYAETLPTTEENIETLKQLGRNVGESAYDLSKRVISGFAKMAEQASERTPPPNVRAGERPVYVEPKREAPPQRRYILPDGRMGSKAELDLSNEMAKERFEEQYATPRVVQENMPSLDRPAPTRAPFRDKLQRQEQQANVDRPVVLPERKGFDWPQVYKDIMSDEPQMEWTKGMTPREQAPPPPPPPSSGGSILGGVGEGQGGHRYVEGGPLELTVGGNRPPIEPRDVYIPSNDTPNPFHSHQTMAARAPEYEGQVVPIPDTPEDRMGEYHLPRLIWPLHELKYKEGYKAKEGLEDYNPPMSEAGERFPTQQDVDFYRLADAYYGRPEAGYIQEGARGSFYDDLSRMTDRQGGYRRDLTPQESDAFKAAFIAAQRNPIAALGFRPEEFDFSGSPYPQTSAGMVSPTSSRIYSDLKFPSVAVHEAVHRGLVELANADRNAMEQKQSALLNEMTALAQQPNSDTKRFLQIGDELRDLRENYKDADIFEPGSLATPEKKDEQEMFVRALMHKMFGPIDKYEDTRQGFESSVAEGYPSEDLKKFMIDNADRINRLEQRALKMLQERQSSGGPRATGGSVKGKSFNEAFNDARSRGDKTFPWTNPETGKTMLYTTQLARKQGGRVPSFNEPDQWIAEPLKPRSVAKVFKPRKTPKIDGTAIVKRASMLSSRKS